MAAEGRHREEEKSCTHVYVGERGKKKCDSHPGRVDHHISREPRQRAVGGVRALEHTRVAACVRQGVCKRIQGDSAWSEGSASRVCERAVASVGTRVAERVQHSPPAAELTIIWHN